MTHLQIKTLLLIIIAAFSSTPLFAQSYLPANQDGATGIEGPLPWEPNWSKYKKITRRVRIVDLGKIYTRVGGDDAGLGAYYQKGKGEASRSIKTKAVDLDNNPATPDWAACLPFSMSEQTSPNTPFWDNSYISMRWYGGYAMFFHNRPEKNSGMTEQYINTCETPNDRQPANNWAFHASRYRKGSAITGYGSWIWKKEDFLHGGRQYPVSFDANSRIGFYRQRYWGGWEGIRFIVGQGGRFYLSESLHNDWNGSAGGMSAWGIDILNPTETRWAEWKPKEGEIFNQFNVAQASFKNMTFDDIDSIGWYIAKDAKTDKIPFYKWECFEAYANVERPDVPCELLAMSEIPASKADEGTVPAFYMSTTELPYHVWKEIYRIFHAIPQWVMDPPNMIFDKDGDMGSMDLSAGRPELAKNAHDQKEPVTDVTLYDALAYCNAMSQHESREPIYYTDPTHKKVFRHVIESCWLKDPKLHARPTIYVKWDADGFRLPTPAEWKAGWADEKPGGGNAWTTVNSERRTHAVGTKDANKNGLHDMVGNVWELVWTYGDSLAPEPEKITVMGGAFDTGGKVNNLAESDNPYGRAPYYGSFNIGFRLIRRTAGSAKPPTGMAPVPESLVWTITASDKTATFTRPEPEIAFVDVPDGSLGTYSMTGFSIGKYEITFAAWKQLLDWAEANGYDLDHDGDMGSMDQGLLIQSHTVDEPLTDVSLQDMGAWCNALSEFNNKTPVYYEDKARTKVYRTAIKYRPLQLRAKEQRTDLKRNHKARPKIDKYGIAVGDLPRFHMYMRWDVNGYRLPSMAEWSYAYSGGKSKGYPWGSGYDGINDSAWNLDNSQMRTHPVGKKKPNAFGLYDIAGNALEWLTDSHTKGPACAIPRGITKNPVHGQTIANGMSKYRAAYARNGYRYEGDRIYAIDRIRKIEGLEEFGALYPGWTWCDLGMRPVAARADTYHVDGINPADVDTKDATPIKNEYLQKGYDPLQNKVHRGNLMRTGAFTTSGLKNATGIMWKFKTSGSVVAAPIAVDGIVYIGSTDGSFYAIDAASGEAKWAFKTNGKIYSSAAVVDEVVYFGSMDANLYALDAKSGALKWKAKMPKANMYGAPGVAYGIVFIGPGGNSGIGQAGWGGQSVIGFDAKTGKKVFSVFKRKSGPQGFESVSIFKERLILRGNTMLNLFTGKAINFDKATFNGASWDSSGHAYESAAITDGKCVSIRLMGGDGAGRPFIGDLRVHDIADKPGKVLWALHPYEPADSYSKAMQPKDGKNHVIETAPTIADGKIFLGDTAGVFYGIGLEKGARLWQYQTGGSCKSSASYAGGLIYFGSDDGYLYALKAENGKLAWKQKIGCAFMSAAWPGDGVIYIGGMDGYVYAVR